MSDNNAIILLYVPVYPHAVYSDDWDGPGESQFGTL